MHGGGAAGTAAAQHAGRLAWALGLTASYMVAEVVGGLVTGSLTLLKQVTHILMEGTPPNVDLGTLERKLMEISGVTAVHDLHVWTVTSGFDAMSGHLVVADMSRGREALREARRVMKDEFGIDHVTIQIEDEAIRAEEAVLHV